MPSVITRGRVLLQPLAASRQRLPLTVELDVTGDGGQLTIGDLRLAAERLEVLGRWESAHRLWSAVGQAALAIDDDALWSYAVDRAGTAIEVATRRTHEVHRSVAVRHDYSAIAAARAAGASFTDVASAHGCSVSTVRRAVDVVVQAQALLVAHADLADALVEGADPDALAAHVGADPAVVRWMLAQRLDRRHPPLPK